MEYVNKMVVGKSCDCLGCRHSSSATKGFAKRTTNRSFRRDGKKALRFGMEARMSKGMLLS